MANRQALFLASCLSVALAFWWLTGHWLAGSAVVLLSIKFLGLPIKAKGLLLGLVIGAISVLILGKQAALVR